ncbi:flagellin [Salinibacter ruber]|nr:flagellin [Salinibacter ruber]MCS4177693.1 flagellin [Salinibacter ruber]
MANAFAINTNIQAQQAFQNLQNTNDQLSSLRERLTTGKRVNEASDDAAGFQIANRLEAKTGAQGQALRNIGDAKSALSTAEGALDSQLSILQSAKEKATQAANGSLSQSQRNAIANELQALGNEVDDIAKNATFNGDKLLSGGSTSTSGDREANELTFQTGAGSDNTFSTQLKNSTTNALDIGGDIDLSASFSDGTEVKAGDFGTSPKPASISASNVDTSGGNLKGELSGGSFEVTVTEDETAADGTGASAPSNNSTLKFKVGDSSRAQTVDVGTSAGTGGTITLESDGSNKIKASVKNITAGQVGEGEEKSFTVSVNDTKNLGDRLQGGSAADARSIIDDVDAAIDKVTSDLSNIGASQNRLSFKESNLETTKTNLSAAQSRIEDADFAQTQTQVAKLQVQQQSGTAQLAQANAAGQSVLSLLGG